MPMILRYKSETENITSPKFSQKIEYLKKYKTKLTYLHNSFLILSNGIPGNLL